MSPKVYVETSIVSYLTSLPSRDLVTAAHQQITREWWARRSRFDLFVSQLVMDEAAGGDPYLVTWNCKHIANAVMRQRIESICRRQGIDPPTICTPEELLEG